MVGFLISAFVTLLVVVDPIGWAPTFIGVTEGLSASLRRQVAVRAALIAAAILVGAALIGNWLLQKLAISLSAFRIAGGLLLFSIATEMVFGVRMQREGEAAEQAVEERAYPAPRPRFRRQKPKMILTRALSLLRCEPADDFRRDGIQRERD
jgi:multiple antibiotic resistance protein